MATWTRSQGANDPRVKQAESENRLKFQAAAEAFLAKYLRGRAEPAPAKDGK